MGVVDPGFSPVVLCSLFPENCSWDSEERIQTNRINMKTQFKHIVFGVNGVGNAKIYKILACSSGVS